MTLPAQPTVQPPRNDSLPNRILIVDDDLTIAKGLEAQLKRYRVTVIPATNLQTALYLFNQNRFDVVMIELEFSELSGLAIIQKWREHEMLDKRSAGFIVMCGKDRTAGEEQLIKELRDLEIINKPFTAIQTLPFLSKAMNTRKRLAAFFEMKHKVIDFYVKVKDFSRAAEFVKKRISNVGPRGLDLLVDLYEKAGRYDDALAIVSRLLEKEQNNLNLLNTQGRLFKLLNRHSEAVQSMERADLLAPGQIERNREMVDLYLKMKRPDDAVRKMKDTVALHPELTDMKFDMFAKLYDSGFSDHALVYGKESVQPMDVVRYYNNKGVALAKSNSLDTAIQQYKRALLFYPDFKENYRIHYNIALASITKKTVGAYREALHSLRRCLTLAPEFSKAKRTLELVEQSLRRTQVAKSPIPGAMTLQIPNGATPNSASMVKKTIKSAS